MTHELKTLHCFFEAVKSGVKNFEVRKDDRGFAVGDTLRLTNTHNGETLEREVGYILRHEDFPAGVAAGFAVLGLRPVNKTYTIKPLKWNDWEEGHCSGSEARAHGYPKVLSCNGKRSFIVMFDGGDLCVRSTMDEAKAAAWDAYVARVEQALEETP